MTAASCAPHHVISLVALAPAFCSTLWMDDPLLGDPGFLLRTVNGRPLPSASRDEPQPSPSPPAPPCPAVRAVTLLTLLAAMEYEKRVAQGLLGEGPRARAAGERVAALERGEMPEEYREGLRATRWPGRAEIVADPEINGGELTFFLDGAHTVEVSDQRVLLCAAARVAEATARWEAGSNVAVVLEQIACPLAGATPGRMILYALALPGVYLAYSQSPRAVHQRVWRMVRRGVGRKALSAHRRDRQPHRGRKPSRRG